MIPDERREEPETEPRNEPEKITFAELVNQLRQGTRGMSEAMGKFREEVSSASQKMEDLATRSIRNDNGLGLFQFQKGTWTKERELRKRKDRDKNKAARAARKVNRRKK